jgi:phosphoribosylaminoimidazole-succinocarboxamide synthase
MLTADHFLRSGKVRDLFTIEDRRLVLVASDRISAFDVVLPTEIPDKGRVLTGISRFWFRETEAMIPSHLLDTDPNVIADAFSAVLETHPDAPADVRPGPGSFDAWRGRVMVCRPAEVVPIEAVVRGYLSGSGWKEYLAGGTVCGIPLPAGLRESDRLPEPIFTPAEKAPAGQHDRNLTFDEMVGHISDTWPFEHLDAGALAERIREAAVRLYRYGAAVAARGGVILADTKFEFGIPVDIDFGLEPAGPVLEQLPYRRPKGGVPDHGGGAFSIDRLMLIDEVMTPDSSRFWDAAAYAPGGAQASFDKQFVRDWLETQAWDKTDPGPALPDDVIAGTRARYVEAYERITGASFERYLRDDVIGPEVRA